MAVTVTVVAALTVTVQDPVPAQAPFQPAKVEPAGGGRGEGPAVPGVTECEQSAPQLMPAGR